MCGHPTVSSPTRWRSKHQFCSRGGVQWGCMDTHAWLPHASHLESHVYVAGLCIAVLDWHPLGREPPVECPVSRWQWSSHRGLAWGQYKTSPQDLGATTGGHNGGRGVCRFLLSYNELIVTITFNLCCTDCVFHFRKLHLFISFDLQNKSNQGRPGVYCL